MDALSDNTGPHSQDRLLGESISIDDSTPSPDVRSSNPVVDQAPQETRKAPWAILAVFFSSYALLMFFEFFMILLPVAIGGWLIYWTLKNPGEAASGIRVAVISAFACTIAGAVLFFQTNKEQMEASFPVLAGAGVTLLVLAVVGIITKTRRG